MAPHGKLFAAFVAVVCYVSVADTQVYVNSWNQSPPAPQAAYVAPQQSHNHLLTQTVYGFLDFTTTIGNTVMVFSPQSAPAPEVKTTPKPLTVIETKPHVQIKDAIIGEIKPSKPSAKPQPKTENAAKQKPDVVLPADTVKDNTKKVTFVQPITEKVKVVSKVDVVAGPSKVVEAKKPIIASKVEVKEETKIVKEPIFSSRVEVVENFASETPQLITSEQQIFEDEADHDSEEEEEDEEAAILVTNNNIGEPEFDFLSRQPSEVVEETYKVINLRPSKAHHKPKHASHKQRTSPSPPPEQYDDDHPVGLVTTLGGTIVKDGLTTIHETSVIGTFISGKYAQVLHSKSQVLGGQNKYKISPTAPQKIVKTAAPGHAKHHHRYNLDPTPAASINEETIAVPNDNAFAKPPRRLSQGGGFKNINRAQQQDAYSEEEEYNGFQPRNPKNHGHRKHKNRPNSSQSPKSKRFGRPSNTLHLATVSVFSEQAAPQSASNRRFKSARNNGFKSTAQVPVSGEAATRRFKPKVNASPVDANVPSSTSLYKFKLNRTSGRWQYKTSPKPHVDIRKMIMNRGEEAAQSTPASIDEYGNDVTPQSRSDIDLELSGSQNGQSLLDDDDDDNSIDKPQPVQTIKVEISTPADFRDVYYEIATIKSPYTFQVGTIKNTRFITVTSTIEKSFEPTEVPSPLNSQTEPLTENILATASPYDKDHNLLDSSIATLPPITLLGNTETPPLETITDTFSTTQTMLKTHILPVIREGYNATSYTLIQTYHVTRLVTATKTLPPMEVYQFVPSKTLNEFNSKLDEAGSELHLELEFGDNNEEDDENNNYRHVFPPELDLANVGSNFDLSEVDKTRIIENHLRHKKAHGANSPKQQQLTEAPPPAAQPTLSPELQQQLALLRFLNPAAAAQIPNVFATSKPVLKYETIYESHVIPVFNGKSTVQSTISRPVSTITKTEYEVATNTLPQLQPPINPLYPQPQYQITSTPVVTQTEVTATESQVLKLTFGAKTTYTTLYSTKVVPTVITTYITQSIPLQQTAAFPGYFPSPYGPYPFVG